MRTAMAWGIGAVALLLATSSEARRASGGVEDVTVIEDGRGSSRVLFRASEELRNLGDVSVLKARLRVPVTGEPAARELALRIYPVTRSWDAGSVSWSGGWSRPGGDIDEEVFASARLSLNGQRSEVLFDVTRLLKESLEQRMVMEGFLLTLDPRTGVGVSATDAARFGDLSAASLEVTYRKALTGSR